MQRLEPLTGTPIAAIVAAYNEAPTIGAVVRMLVASKRFRDVIVVSDGSTDNTAELARLNGASLVLHLPKKSGKGAALIHGVSRTDARVLFFCDADLYGLTFEHIDKILAPVMDGRLTMNVGIHDRGSFLRWLSSHLPLIGGERALRREIFDAVPEKYLQGFMVEEALNYACRRRGLPYGSVPMIGLHIRRKMQKVGVTRGLFEYIRMTWQIVYAMVIVRLARV